MRVEQLKPPPTRQPRRETPQCEALPWANSREDGWRKKHYGAKRPDMDPTRCQRESSLRIDGKYYCRLHAGQVVLKHYLENNK
jgi:hypothetical protein